MGVGIGVPRARECGGIEIIGIGSGERANRLEIVAGNDVVFADPIATRFFFFIVVFIFEMMMVMVLWRFFHEVDEVLALRLRSGRRRRSVTVSEIHNLLVHKRRRIHR